MHRTGSLIVACLITLASLTPEGYTANHSTKLKATTNTSVLFTANEGQWNDQVLFRTTSGGVTAWLTPSGITHHFIRRLDQEGQPVSIEKAVEQRGEHDIRTEHLTIRMDFVGANPIPTIVADDKLDYHCNYFLGNDRSRWKTHVPNYRSVTYENIYPGIDIRFKDNDGRLEYEFIVAPDADVSQIQVEYASAEELSIESNGDLVVARKWAGFKETGLLAYEGTSDRQSTVPIKLQQRSGKRVGFTVEQDRTPGEPLVIDPTIDYSTVVGYSSDEAVLDADVYLETAYISGATNSAFFPTEDPYDIYNGGTDAFVTVVSNSGSNLIYSTYIGGADDDAGRGIKVRSAEAHITGYTHSTNFPVANAVQDVYGGQRDAFVLKLNGFGDALEYSTYVGGAMEEIGTDIDIDVSGNAVISGTTESFDFPATPNAYDSFGDNFDDAFVALFTPTGSMPAATHLAGASAEFGEGVAFGPGGNIYVVGLTRSTDFPLDGAIVTTPPTSVLSHAYVTKFTNDLSSLQFSTFLGGSERDVANDVEADNLGRAYLCGYTDSPDFQTMETLVGLTTPGRNMFLTVLAADGSDIEFSSAMGIGEARDVEVDQGYNIYLAGTTAGSGIPALAAVQPSLAGMDDAAAQKLHPSGSSWSFTLSTYLGSSDVDGGYGVGYDGSGHIYTAGIAGASDFPTRTGAFDESHNGLLDGFVTKITGELTFIGGDVNADFSGPNVSDLTFMVDFLFRGGLRPMIYEAADANCDQTLNVSDVTYLVGYLFQGGNPPPCGNQ